MSRPGGDEQVLAVCDGNEAWIEPKHKLPHSPNRSDVIAMIFWELPGVMGDGVAETAALNAEIASPTRRRRDREETAGSVWED